MAINPAPASLSASAQAIFDGAKGLVSVGMTKGLQAWTFCAEKVSAFALWAFAEMSQAYAAGSEFAATNWPVFKATVAPYSWHIAGGVAALVVLNVAYNLWQLTKAVVPPK